MLRRREGMSLKISIIYDNEASKGFITGWGFAAMIEIGGKKILFDTGWDGIALLKNLETAKFDPREIDYIIISHKHWDHLGGLNSLLYQTNNPTVFLPSSISSKLKAEITKFADLREVTDKVGVEIIPNLWTTPQLETPLEGVTEIAVAIETAKGIIVVCGCSHPGLDTIINTIAKKGKKIYAVLGGFHGFDKLDKLQEIELVIPCHCTEKKKEILAKYPKNSKECYSGLVLAFE